MVRFAPAKINLNLEIVGRREDGYHLLQSVMVPLEFADELSFERAKDGIDFTCDDPDLAVDETNLVVRAARSFFAVTGLPMGVRIHLRKRIPTQAGLGGGSSDAATTLLTLSELFEVEIDRDLLRKIALDLGADVPFFLERTACLVSGIGERAIPYKVVSEQPVTLVKPRQGLSTPAVYRALNWPLTHQVKPNTLPTSLETADAVCAHARNDLEPPAEQLLPQIRDCKRLLSEYGAVCVRMSGSGPTVFGIFDEFQAADRARDAAEERGWWSCATKTQH